MALLCGLNSYFPGGKCDDMSRSASHPPPLWSLCEYLSMFPCTIFSFGCVGILYFIQNPLTMFVLGLLPGCDLLIQPLPRSWTDFSSASLFPCCCFLPGFMETQPVGMQLSNWLTTWEEFVSRVWGSCSVDLSSLKESWHPDLLWPELRLLF